MTDFFDRVERELGAAADRAATQASTAAGLRSVSATTTTAATGTTATKAVTMPNGAAAFGGSPALGPARRRGRVAAWIASHSVLALVGGAVLVGGAGATAAVVSIHGTPSHPTAGVIPRRPQEHRRRSLHYRFTMFPSLVVGHPGWCSSILERPGTTGRWLGGGGCGDAPPADAHTFDAGWMYLGSGRGSLVYSVVDRTIGYVQLTSGEKVIPTSDPSLPNGWRAVILLPGDSHDGKMHYLDRAGRPAKVEASVSGKEWAAAQAKLPPWTLDKSTVPVGSPCTITLPAGASPRSSHWITDLKPVAGLAGYAFTACAQTALRIDDQWAEVTTLVDAAQPGKVAPAGLASGTPSPTDHAILEIAATQPSYPSPPGQPFSFKTTSRGPYQAGQVASARRVGNAWLVVRAKSRVLRERLLREVRIGVRG